MPFERERDKERPLCSKGFLLFQVVRVVKNPPANARDVRDLGSIPGLGRSPGEGHDLPVPLQYSCLENPMDRGAWQATVHGVASVGHDLATKPLPFAFKALSHTLSEIFSCFSKTERISRISHLY